MRRRVSTWRAVPRLRCSSPASRSTTVMCEVVETRPRSTPRTVACARHSQPEPPWSGWPMTRSVRFCRTGCPNRSMKSSAGTFSSSRVPPSPSGLSSSQSRGMAGREAAWPCGSPKVTARFGLLSSSRATTRWPRSARTRASVPATVVLPEPPFPPMAIFIVHRRYRNGGAVARMTRAQSCRMKELDRLLVDLHVLAVGDGGGLGRADEVAPAPRQTCRVELLEGRLMVLERVHLGEVVVHDDLGEAGDQRVGIVTEGRVLLGEIHRVLHLGHQPEVRHLRPVGRRLDVDAFCERIQQLRLTAVRERRDGRRIGLRRWF